MRLLTWGWGDGKSVRGYFSLESWIVGASLLLLMLLSWIYLFLMAEAMIEGGVLMGLPRSVATTLVGQTIAGAGLMLKDSGNDAATLRGNVTSPGGTTAAGLRVLEQRGVRSALIDAVAAATERSRELG